MTEISPSTYRPSTDILRSLAHGDRYRHFVGASGQRYIFTLMSAEDLADCRQAVVLLLPGSQPKSRKNLGDRPFWFGEVDIEGNRRGPRIKPATLKSSNIYVHLLADCARERTSILEDLKSRFG